ncbi:MAG: nucleotidyltransferase family protein [Pseudomonadota bacterium]
MSGQSPNVRTAPLVRTPHTAMVLAAGLGTRMRPLTDNLPKPLIAVDGKALIDHTLDRFAAAGVQRAVVNVHYLADKIEAHVKSREAPKISLSDERETLLETGGGLKKAAPLLGDDPVFCTNTDAILVDDPGAEACTALAEAFDAQKMDMLLLLTPISKTSGYDGKGDFNRQADGRLEFRDGESAQYVFTGLQIIKPSLAADGPEGPFSTKILWEKAISEGRLFGIVHQGFWMHVGDPAGLAAAEAYLKDARRQKA